MRPQSRSFLSAVGICSCAALARAEDLPSNPGPAPQQDESQAVVAQPQSAPPGNAAASVQPVAQPQASAAAGVEALAWPEPGPPAPRTVSRWYGDETLLTDGASLALFIGAVSQSDGDSGAALGSLSLAVYLLGGPVVHLVHENPGRALGSLALRAGLPLTLGYLGVAAESCEDGELFCGVGGAVLGGLAGIVTSIVVDAALLTHERVPAKTSSVPSVSVYGDGRRTLITAGGYF